MLQFPFIKMDGTQNDFVIIDTRGQEIAPDLSDANLQLLASRDNNITKGCDQIAVLETSVNDGADVFMRIFNADGGQVDACGNVTRCVAWLEARRLNKNHIDIETNSGLLGCKVDIEAQNVSVNMGHPRLEWQEIPLASSCDTLSLNVGQGMLQNPAAVNMGNPHAVFFVPDVNVIDFDHNNLGHNLEHNALFPQRVNVGVVQLLSNLSIWLRVYERGAGETLACGTGACAAVVAGVRRGMLQGNKDVSVQLKGGELTIRWNVDGDNNVHMAGAVNLQFNGVVDIG